MQFHPSDLTAVLELAWDRRVDRTNLELGHPFYRSALFNLSTTWFGSRALSGAAPPPPPLASGQPNLNEIINAINGASCGVTWDHLIYAYMIENTRIYEIFRRVVHESCTARNLALRDSRSIPGSAESQRWLRTTEELFYRDPPAFFITAITSHMPATDATRRNAYQRMFGMDLNHGTDDDKPYLYVKAEAANTEFVSTFRRVPPRSVGWHREPATIESGANPTDDAKIADLAERLHGYVEDAPGDGQPVARGVRLCLNAVLVPPDRG